MRSPQSSSDRIIRYRHRPRATPFPGQRQRLSSITVSGKSWAPTPRTALHRPALLPAAGPSSAGTGYDAAQSSGSNLRPNQSPTSGPHRRLRRTTSRRKSHNSDPNRSTHHLRLRPGPRHHSSRRPIPNSPNLTISPHPESTLRALIGQHTRPRQLGFLGELRINVLELNQSLDAKFPQ